MKRLQNSCFVFPQVISTAPPSTELSVQDIYHLQSITFCWHINTLPHKSEVFIPTHVSTGHDVVRRGHIEILPEHNMDFFFLPHRYTARRCIFICPAAISKTARTKTVCYEDNVHRRHRERNRDGFQTKEMLINQVARLVNCTFPARTWCFLLDESAQWTRPHGVGFHSLIFFKKHTCTYFSFLPPHLDSRTLCPSTSILLVNTSQTAHLFPGFFSCSVRLDHQSHFSNTKSFDLSVIRSLRPIICL